MKTDIDIWRARAALKEAVRVFFGQRDYLELDTPIMVQAPGMEVHLDYFQTTWIDHDQRPHARFLQSSPELHMKRAVCHGAERVFQFARCFRNQGEFSAWHHPEFTMLEWYEVGMEYHGFMDQTEALLRATQQQLADRFAIKNSVRLPPRMQRLTVAEAFKEFAQLDLIDNDADLAAQARANNCLSVQANDDFETAFFKILIEKIEPGLAQLGAAFLYDYPASMAVLAKVENGVARRFEIYIDRVELCNAFLELGDAAENRRRWQAANQLRIKSGRTAIPEDEMFLADLQIGMPACSGNALGFDRWLALILGHQNLDQVIPFRRNLAT